MPSQAKNSEKPASTRTAASVAAHAASKTAQELGEQLSAVGRQFNDTSADFLRIDVETALTFTGLALTTDNQEKKKRNRKNARKAYNTVLHLLPRVTFTPSGQARLQDMLARLKKELVQLGERL